MLAMRWSGGTSSVYIRMGKKFGSFFLSFSLSGRGGGITKAGVGQPHSTHFPAENIPEVACQDQSILPLIPPRMA